MTKAVGSVIYLRNISAFGGMKIGLALCALEAECKKNFCY